MRGQKDLRSMKKGVNWIEHQGENWCKILQNCEMTDYYEKIYQLQAQISLEQNMMETTQFFSAERGVNKIDVGIK